MRVWPIGQRNGEARLVAGRADPGGAWEYGRLEVIVNGVFSTVLDGFRVLVRRGASVACRSLGYVTGAQFLAGGASAFPAPGNASVLIRAIICEGSEASLADCDIDTDFEGISFNLEDVESITQAAALICATPSGAAFALI